MITLCHSSQEMWCRMMERTRIDLPELYHALVQIVPLPTVTRVPAQVVSLPMNDTKSKPQRSVCGVSNRPIIYKHTDFNPIYFDPHDKINPFKISVSDVNNFLNVMCHIKDDKYKFFIDTIRTISIVDEILPWFITTTPVVTNSILSVDVFNKSSQKKDNPYHKNSVKEYCILHYQFKTQQSSLAFWMNVDDQYAFLMLQHNKVYFRKRDIKYIMSNEEAYPYIRDRVLYAFVFLLPRYKIQALNILPPRLTNNLSPSLKELRHTEIAELYLTWKTLYFLFKSNSFQNPCEETVRNMIGKLESKARILSSKIRERCSYYPLFDLIGILSSDTNISSWCDRVASVWTNRGWYSTSKESITKVISVLIRSFNIKNKHRSLVFSCLRLVATDVTKLINKLYL